MLASQPTGSPRNLGILMRACIGALCRRFGSDSYGRLRGRPWQMELGVGCRLTSLFVVATRLMARWRGSIRWMVKCLRSGPPAKVALG